MSGESASVNQDGVKSFIEKMASLIEGYEIFILLMRLHYFFEHYSIRHLH